MVQVRARLGEHNEADLGTKMVDLRRMTSLLKGTLLRPPMGWSSWMVAATLRAVAEAAKDIAVYLIWNVRNIHVRDERLVLDLCGNGHCDPDRVVRRTVRESHWTDEVGRRRPTRMLHNYVQKKMSSGMMRRYPDPDSAWDLIACDAERRVQAKGWDDPTLRRTLRHLPRSVPQPHRWFLLKVHFNATIASARLVGARVVDEPVQCCFCSRSSDSLDHLSRCITVLDCLQ